MSQIPTVNIAAWPISLWLAAATKTRSLSFLPTDFPIIDLTPVPVQDGPLDVEQDPDMELQINDGCDDGPPYDLDYTYTYFERLQVQLPRWSAQRLTSTLYIKGDTPLASQFSLISSAFPNVKRLYIETGPFEEWNNDGFPSRSTWPLELLVIGGADGEPIEDPGDVSEWLINQRTGLPFYETTGSASESKLRKLEILENDAIETFVRFTVAHPETIMTVQELTIRSLGGCVDMPGGILGAVLPHLGSLRHLDLGWCYDVYFPVLESELWSGRRPKQRSPPWLVQGLPPNLETLYFRGPMEIAHGNEGRWLAEWTEAFGNSDYLPRLKRVGFWLDQPDKDGDGPEKDTRFPERFKPPE
ncbi:hypothetical protein V8F33_006315 [Rhypophila sp. PSN 637]